MLHTSPSAPQRKQSRSAALVILGVVVALAVLSPVSLLVAAYFWQVEFTLGNYQLVSRQNRLPAGYPRSEPFIVTNQTGIYVWYLDGQFSRIAYFRRER